VTEVELESESADSTERAASRLAEALRPGDVVLVEGDVGTGKTTFVRAACRRLGVSEPVTSPSFTIGRTYSGRLPVSHLDLFRLDTLEGEDPTLLDDYLAPDAVVFVEWPAAAASELEPERVVLRLRLEHLGGHRRRLHVTGSQELVETIEQAIESAG
jgi:tRNA threonylcarbamoyladenosine biosynthesis protein TsaE